MKHSFVWLCYYYLKSFTISQAQFRDNEQAKRITTTNNLAKSLAQLSGTKPQYEMKPKYELNSLSKMPGSLGKVLGDSKKSNLINSFPSEGQTQVKQGQGHMHHIQNQRQSLHGMGYPHGGSSPTPRRRNDVSSLMPSHAPESNGSPVGSPIYSMPEQRSNRTSTPNNSRPPSPNATAPDVVLYWSMLDVTKQYTIHKNVIHVYRY